jgi:hypothetical protein
MSVEAFWPRRPIGNVCGHLIEPLTLDDVDPDAFGCRGFEESPYIQRFHHRYMYAST